MTSCATLFILSLLLLFFAFFTMHASADKIHEDFRNSVLSFYSALDSAVLKLSSCDRIKESSVHHLSRLSVDFFGSSSPCKSHQRVDYFLGVTISTLQEAGLEDSDETIVFIKSIRREFADIVKEGQRTVGSFIVLHHIGLLTKNLEELTEKVESFSDSIKEEAPAEVVASGEV